MRKLMFVLFAGAAACGGLTPDEGETSSALSQAYLHAAVCPQARLGFARCHAWVRVDEAGEAAAAATPSGYGPADLASAYNLSGSSSQTIAIVDAFDDPNAEADLQVYRAQFGLPVCTTANGCFQKVNQSGNPGPYPAGNTGWAEEISLDLDMASAICPKAAALGASVISNSYGGGEFRSEASFEGHYNHPGIAITVSSGDGGYGVEFPAASQYVTAVGGTSLSRASNARGWSETVWSGAGSGCSRYISKPSWQLDTGCSRRTVADVSAVADPNTGVAVYDTYGVGGWLVFGGTSVSAPIIASVYALAGNAGSVVYGSYSYSHTSALFDVTSGSNGRCHRTPYLCTGEPGYDGPTGNGTPDGTGGF